MEAAAAPIGTILSGMANRLAPKLTPEQDAEIEASQQKRAAEELQRTLNQRLRAVYDKVGKRYHPSKASLDSYEVYHDRQRATLDRLRAFPADSDRGLVLYGTVGTGKDHLLVAMLYAAVRAGKRADWINGQDIFGRFRDAMDSGESEGGLIREFVKPDVLGISDPIPPVVDPKKPAAWRTELLYRVLDARYRQCKPTWVTINAKSPEDADGQLSAPVFDRLRDDAELVPCFWPSYRERPREKR
jgi:DNA replication protein DnaC